MDLVNTPTDDFAPAGPGPDDRDETVDVIVAGSGGGIAGAYTD